MKDIEMDMSGLKSDWTSLKGFVGHLSRLADDLRVEGMICTADDLDDAVQVIERILWEKESK